MKPDMYTFAVESSSGNKCDNKGCRVGFAVGHAATCAASTVGSAVVTTLACSVGAVFTFGLSCAASLAGVGVSAGLCGVGGEISDMGKIINVLVLQFYFCQGRARVG